MKSNSTISSTLEALHNLNKTSAIAVSDNTSVPSTTSHSVVDHCLATHLARSKDSFAFVPELDLWRTYGIFRSAKQAWQHDRLPVLAVCAFPKSPAPFQRQTGIRTQAADQFLSDLQLAHRIAPPNASPAYVIRHNHSPNDKYDQVILPAHANLIVYQSHALSSAQLTTLIDHVASVRGKIILCDDRSDFANSHPDLTEAVERSISRAVPDELRKNLQPPNPADEKPRINIQNPVTLGNNSRPVRDLESMHVDQLPPGTSPSERSRYFVYHAKTAHPAGFSSDDYDLVAIVEAENIHSALASTRHFAAPWTDNPGVVSFPENNRQHRSTQPGDVIVHRGIAQFFDGNGFQLIEPAIDKQPPPSHDWAPSIESPTLDTPAPKPPRHDIDL